jgi:hypothetical protein
MDLDVKDQKPISRTASRVGREMVNLIVPEDCAVPGVVVADPHSVIGDKLNQPIVIHLRQLRTAFAEESLSDWAKPDMIPRVFLERAFVHGRFSRHPDFTTVPPGAYRYCSVGEYLNGEAAEERTTEKSFSRREFSTR